MARITDDLGMTFNVADDVRRVVSLVPSLTESLAATDRSQLVGATDWCTHPFDLDVTRVRGTKNPDLAAIRALRPDLVIANKEENRELDVRRLRDAGVPVWVTDIESVDQALHSLQRLFIEGLQRKVPDWLHEAREVWSAPPSISRIRAVIPIWRDPWMVVGSSTFTGDLAWRAGLDNVFGGSVDRYPQTTVEEILAAEPDLIVLPDEPYEFTTDDGPEALPGVRCALVEGRCLTWYGPSLVSARATLLAALTDGLTS